MEEQYHGLYEYTTRLYKVRSGPGYGKFRQKYVANTELKKTAVVQELLSSSESDILW